MLKLRLKRIGRKGKPFYRLVIMENSSRRDGRPIDELGFYDPIEKYENFNKNSILKWLKKGVKPTEIVKKILIRENIIDYLEM